MTNIIQTVMFSLGTLNLTIGIVILLSLAANKLFGKRYSAGCRYIIWTLIILRLCIPLSVDTLPEISKLSLPESITIESKEDHIPPVGNTDVINKTDSEISSNNSEQSPEGEIHFDEGEAVDTPPIIPNGNIQNNVDVSGTVPSDTNAPSSSDSVTFNTENVLMWMFWCWLTVAAIIFTVRISGYVIYSRRVRKNITPADSEMCELLRHVADDMGLNTGSLPPLYFTDSASSPMLFGFTKPMILLPSLCRYDVELKGILSHELVHYRRKDLWIKLACVFAVSLNWFNPLVYIAAVKVSREMELSCDEKVLKKYDKDARISYSRSMLRVVEQCCSGHSSLTTQFDPKKSAIVERFAGILDSKKKKRGIVIIAIVLLTCIMSTGIVLWQMEPDPIPSPDSETTGYADTEDFEESNSENTAEPDKTEPEDIQTEPIETEPYIDTSIDTSATAEPEPTETQSPTEQPTETQSKTYICTADMFTKDGFLTQPEYIPALTLNDDGTLIFRVYYIGGVTDVPGTYEIEDNHIYIDCVLEGTPVYGFFPDGGAWMDNKFMFEIVDEDTLIFYGHPDDTGDVRCYTVEPGYVFKRGTQLDTNALSVVEPEQTHVGVWYMDSDKQQYIRITRMKSDMIVFSAKPYPDALHFSICAVKQGDEYVFGKDISPRDTDRLAEKNLSGKLILEDNGVKLIYNPSDLWETEIVQQFTIKNEVDKIDLSKGDLPIGISEKLQSIIDKLSNVGWTDFEVIPHEPNTRIRWNVILDSYDLPTNAKLYCVTARTKLIYVNVYAVFEGEEQIDEVIYYVSISGRVMEKIHLENFMQRYNCGIIIPANNEDLHYYFESY